jgi:hypothetical protein
MKRADQAIDWRDSSSSGLRKIRCADSFPGVFNTVLGMLCYLHGDHEERVSEGHMEKSLPHAMEQSVEQRVMVLCGSHIGSKSKLMESHP